MQFVHSHIRKTFKEGPIFVKFHTIPLEKDEETDKRYPRISIIQVGYISEHFQLNIKASKQFEPFKFNESWINYKRTSGALTVKCQSDKLYILLDLKVFFEELIITS